MNHFIYPVEPQKTAGGKFQKFPHFIVLGLKNVISNLTTAKHLLPFSFLRKRTGLTGEGTRTPQGHPPL